MSNEWMIDVLADLRKFAAKQTMLDLAEHLDDAIVVAATEIRNLDECSVVGVGLDDAQTGNISGTLRSS